MSQPQTNELKSTKCPICNASYTINITINEDDDFNKFCFNCSRCHLCFCSLCNIFPFHYNQKCPKNLSSQRNLISNHNNIIQVTKTPCEKLDTSKFNSVINSISHPNIKRNLLDELISISKDFCLANLIQINEEDPQNDLKDKIFDQMNIYICNKHQKPHIFILGHKNDCEIDNKDACPICNCGQIPICPEHKYRYMSYKCCKCCSTATHIELNGRKLCFLCEKCFQMSALNEKNSEDCQNEKKCRFFPYQCLVSEIVGRCDKCGRLFVT